MNAAPKPVVGVDTAKNVFQVYTVDKETGEVINQQIKRARFLQWFANRAPCLVGMEACGGAQHWARKLQALGHELKLMSGKLVKAFVCGNKNDAADARAICLATRQLEAKAVAIKTEAQQAVLAMHRIRQQLVKMRAAQMNALRGLLAEYGEVFGQGRKAFDIGMKPALERLAERLPTPSIDTLRDQWNEPGRLDERIVRIEKSLLAWLRQDRAAKAISAIPGAGLLTATAAVATMGQGKTFWPGPEFAAWIGLSQASPWLQQLSQRRPRNVVIVALANKIARTIWAVLAHERTYDKNHGSLPPLAAAST